MASIGPKEIYLISYNAACCAGWAIVWIAAVKALIAGIPEDGLVDTLAKVYYADGLELALSYAQSAAIMEIVHAVVGLVRSPAFVTAMQVSSRIVALVAVLYAPTAQGTFEIEK